MGSYYQIYSLYIRSINYFWLWFSFCSHPKFASVCCNHVAHVTTVVILTMFQIGIKLQEMGSPSNLNFDWKDFSYKGSRRWQALFSIHYSDVITSVMTFQITSLTIVYSTVHSGADQRKHQSSASLAFVQGIHRWPLNSLHKSPNNVENASIWWRHHDFFVKYKSIQSISNSIYSKMSLHRCYCVAWCLLAPEHHDIKNNAWVTVNNDFWVTSEAICH